MLIEGRGDEGRSEVPFVFEGSKCFVEVEGVGRIAERRDRKWIPLKSGWSVLSLADHKWIEVSYDGAE